MLDIVIMLIKNDFGHNIIYISDIVKALISIYENGLFHKLYIFCFMKEIYHVVTNQYDSSFF